MDPVLRRAYNAAFTPALYEWCQRRLTEELGPRSFRTAETPLFLPDALRCHIERTSREVLALLSDPARIARMRVAIPPRHDAPGMDALPGCAQLDFAVVSTEDGRLEGRLVELQGFPSVYGLTHFHGQIFRQAIERMPGVARPLRMWFGDLDEQSAVSALRKTVVADEDPACVVTLDLIPRGQKTCPDFVATERLLGVEPACATELVRQGDRLYRRKAGRLVPVRRIYNRVVFDELERTEAALPFSFSEPLEVSWCPHPNWYWVWSKFSLLHLCHPAVPEALGGDDPRALEALAAEPGQWVLKPLFSFAGAGVKVAATAEDLLAISPERRSDYLLQRRVHYARRLLTPQGDGVAAEVRVMCLRAADEPALRPVWTLVRLSRGPLMGVDQNREQSWTGSTVALW